MCLPYLTFPTVPSPHSLGPKHLEVILLKAFTWDLSGSWSSTKPLLRLSWPHIPTLGPAVKLGQISRVQEFEDGPDRVHGG